LSLLGFDPRCSARRPGMPERPASRSGPDGFALPARFLSLLRLRHPPGGGGHR
jgi:hypothetical protein